MFHLRLGISIHALREEGDTSWPEWSKSRRISIHALREEGDRSPGLCSCWNQRFLSTPSARRATIILPPLALEGQQFLSTPSARRATSRARIASRCTSISIHALREEGDLSYGICLLFGAAISIHALREEGDDVGGQLFQVYVLFLSTPSARRATEMQGNIGQLGKISIHALREEGDIAFSIGATFS